MHERARLLQKIAKRSIAPVNRHATLLMKGGAIIAWGFNRADVHAEIAALRRASSAKGATCWNLRLTRSGQLGNSRPCAKCWKALKQAGVERVFYTFSPANVLEQLAVLFVSEFVE